LVSLHRSFYKVEKWTKDGSKVDRMLHAGSGLDKAREVFAAAIYHRPCIRLTTRMRQAPRSPMAAIVTTSAMIATAIRSFVSRIVMSELEALP
jgi:hypothetical protein